MTIDIYTPQERLLLETWFRGGSIDANIEQHLEASGFSKECVHYTPLDAWVGSFTVSEIQRRLPNCGICRDDGVVLTRKLRPTAKRKVNSISRHLFTINWADSAPGLSWPAAYYLTWLSEFERFVLTYSADGTDAFGYCDFALGWIGPEKDWREGAREILIADWRSQFAGWEQAPWAYLFDSGHVSEVTALAWRAEAWRGHEDIDEPGAELLEA